MPVLRAKEGGCTFVGQTEGSCSYSVPQLWVGEGHSANPSCIESELTELALDALKARGRKG